MEQPRGVGLVKLAVPVVLMFDVVMMLVVASSCGTNCTQFWSIALSLALASIVVLVVIAAVDTWMKRSGGLGSLPPRNAYFADNNDFRSLVAAVAAFFAATSIWVLKSYLCAACSLVGDIVAFVASYVAATYIVRRLTSQHKN